MGNMKNIVNGQSKSIIATVNSLPMLPNEKSEERKRGRIWQSFGSSNKPAGVVHNLQSACLPS